MTKRRARLQNYPTTGPWRLVEEWKLGRDAAIAISGNGHPLVAGRIDAFRDASKHSDMLFPSRGSKAVCKPLTVSGPGGSVVVVTSDDTDTGANGAKGNEFPAQLFAGATGLCVAWVAQMYPGAPAGCLLTARHGEFQRPQFYINYTSDGDIEAGGRRITSQEDPKEAKISGAATTTIHRAHAVVDYAGTGTVRMKSVTGPANLTKTATKAGFDSSKNGQILDFSKLLWTLLDYVNKVQTAGNPKRIKLMWMEIHLKVPSAEEEAAIEARLDALRTLWQDAAVTIGSISIDLANADCYSSGQKVLDLSGNGFDFYIGADGSATVTDPTLVGTAGSLSKDTYLSFDGGDYLAYDSALEPWVNNVHKAGGKLSVQAWVWFGADGAAQGIISDQGGVTSNLGFAFYRSSTNKLAFRTGNGVGAAISVLTAMTVPSGQWVFCGLSFSEAVGAEGLILQINGTQEKFSSTAVTPSASSAGQNLKIGAFGSAANPLSNGSRLNAIDATEAVLSAAELMAVYDATKERYA